MTVDTRGLFAEGARRVLRYQRVLWWLFVVNALFAMFAVRPGAEQFGDVLDHSLHAQRLSDAFDIFAFINWPPSQRFRSGPQRWSPRLLAHLFCSLVIYDGRNSRSVSSGPKAFYRGVLSRLRRIFLAMGAHELCLVVILAPLLLLAGVVYDWSGNLSENATQKKLGFWVLLAGGLLLALVLMVVRLWFDMAQVRAVAENGAPSARVSQTPSASPASISLRSFGFTSASRYCVGCTGSGALDLERHAFPLFRALSHHARTCRLVLVFRAPVAACQ